MCRTLTRTRAGSMPLQSMIDGNFRRLPVVEDDGKVIAMLSMHDVPPEYRIMHRQWVEWTDGKGTSPAPK